MAEFGAAATLEVTIPDKELRDAQSKIERELGGVSVNVDAQPSRQSPAAMSDGGFGDVETLMSAQLETLGDIHDELEKMGASGGPGGGGGGGGMVKTLLATAGASSIAGGSALGGGSLLTGLGLGGAASKLGRGAGMLGRLGGARGVPLVPGRGSKRTIDEQKETFEKTNQIREMLGLDKREEPDWQKVQEQRQSEMPTLEEPEWVDELSSFQLEEPQWVSNIGQQFQIDKPQWISTLTGGGGSQYKNVSDSYYGDMGDRSGGGDIGDITIDVANEFGVDLESLQTDIESTIEEQKQEMINEAVREIESRLPDFGF